MQPLVAFPEEKENINMSQVSGIVPKINLPDSTSPKPEIIVKIIKALVNIHTASPEPSMVPLPRGVVGNSPLKTDERVSFKTEELVGGSAIMGHSKTVADFSSQ